MAGRKKRKTIEYALDDDFLSPIDWPGKFAAKPAYALLRPLSEYSNPWRTSRKAVAKYLNGQARRLGGRYYVEAYFKELSVQAGTYSALHGFLLNPFGKHVLSSVLPEIEIFLRKTFKAGKLYEKTQQGCQYLVEIEGCFNKSFIENALKECPDLLARPYNEDFARDMFSSPAVAITVMLDDKTVDATMPVVLGTHYINKKGERFLKKKGYDIKRILGCYARWDNARMLIRTEDADRQEALKAVQAQGFAFLGDEKNIQRDGLDYLVSLLIESDLPSQSFTVGEWEVNCPELTIVKDNK